MADIETLSRALKRAHEAGDTNAARKFAAEIKRQRAGPPARGNSSASEEGWGDVARQFGDRFSRGLYSMVNFPTDAANLAASAVGSDYRFKRPLEAISPEADAAIMDVPEAHSPAGRLAGTVGEFMGANALPGAGVIAAAPRIAAATQGANSLAGQSVNRLARGITAAPGTAAAGEVLASVGSGVGASMAEDAGPNAQYLASVAGGFAAPMALAVSPTRMAISGGNALRRRFSPEAVGQKMREQTVDAIRQEMSPDAEEAIAASTAIQRDAPGYRPSVAEATENQSFIATQHEFEKNLSGPALDRAVRRYRENEQAIARAVNERGPQSPMDVDEAFRVGADRIEGINQRIDRSLSGLDARQERLGAGLQTGQRQRELGATVREGLIARRGDIKEEMSFTARDMGLDDTDARFPFDQLRERLIQIVQPRSGLADRGAMPNDIIADLRKAPDSVSIVDLMTLRSRITDDIREAARMATGARRIPYLQAMKSELDGAADALIRSVGDEALADDMRRFRQMYLEDYIQPFEQGAAAKVLKTDATGAYTVPDEQVVKEFFGGWNQTAADQFRRIFPDAPAANAAMETAALDDLHSFALRDGVIGPGRVEAWIRKNAGVLKDFPQINSRVNRLDAALNDISARRAVLASRKKHVERTVLAREIARIDGAAATPEAVIQSAIRNPARMQRLMNGIKEPQARNAIAREVWDQALGSGDPLAFLRDNRQAMIRALGNRYGTALNLARAISKNRLVPRPAGRAIDANPVASVENVLGSGLNQISSRVFAVKSGRTSARYALTDIAGRAFRNMTGRQARETLQEALYDPEIARTLANTLQHKTISEKGAKRLYTFLLSNGVLSSEEGGEPSQ